MTFKEKGHEKILQDCESTIVRDTTSCVDFSIIMNNQDKYYCGLDLKCVSEIALVQR